MATEHALQFLGVGDARNLALGSSSAVYERDGEPCLLIDCGPTTQARFVERYQRQPRAVFITHLHMDHVGGLEGLFYSAWFDPELRGRIKLYLPVGLAAYFHARVATFPSFLAEGGANFYDAFQTVLVSDHFWHAGVEFSVFAVRHHAPGSAFGLALPRHFVYTGDTRPIPEVLAQFQHNEPIFHDVSLTGNASHSGVDELLTQYPSALLARTHFYHLRSLEDAAAVRAKGLNVVPPMGRFVLHV